MRVHLDFRSRLRSGDARAGRPESGQALVLMVLCLVVLLGMAGLVVDIGRSYVAQRQLQQAVDAAALAAAQDLPDTANTNTTITSYSALAGNKNAHSLMMNASAPTVTYKCLTSTGIPCETGSGKCGCNAVQVSETATVNTTFLNLFGTTKFSSVSATSTVSIHGGTPHPLDIAVVLDTTGSMNSACGNNVSGITNGQATKLDCAKEGVRALLSSLYPCDPSLATCGTAVNGNVAKPLDEVSLFTFPGLTTPSGFTHDNASTKTHTDLSLEFGCPGGLHATPTWYTPLSSSDKDEVETVTVNATGGKFTITYGGSKSANIAYNATASTVETALDAITGTNNTTVTALTGQPTNTHAWKIEFISTLGNQDLSNPNPALTVATAASPNQLSGGTHTVTVAVTTSGSSSFPQFYLDGSEIGYPSSNSSYQIVGLSSDYRADDVTTTLASGSKLVQASSFSSCNGGSWPGNEYYGVNSPGGAGTYIASAITAAQNALHADSGRNATPVLIVLSDGDASTQPTGSSAPCGEAVQAAQDAEAAGTQVYSIAYDASNSSTTCSQDPYPTFQNPITHPTGFTTMRDIASDATKFYCLNPPSGGTCNSASATSLKQIFAEIGIDVTNSRIVGDDAS